MDGIRSGWVPSVLAVWLLVAGLGTLGTQAMAAEGDLSTVAEVTDYVLATGSAGYVDMIKEKRDAEADELSASQWAAVTMALLELHAELGQVDALASIHERAANPYGYGTKAQRQLLGVLVAGGHQAAIEPLRGGPISKQADVAVVERVQRLAAIEEATFADFAAAQVAIEAMPVEEQPSAWFTAARLFLIAGQDDAAVAAIDAISDETIRTSRARALGLALLRQPWGKFDFDGTQARPVTYPAFERYAKRFPVDARTWVAAADRMEDQGYAKVMQICLLNAVDAYMQESPRSLPLGLLIVYRLPHDNPNRNPFLGQLLAYHQKNSPDKIALQVDHLCALGRADEARALIEAQEGGWDYLRDIVSPIRQLCYGGQIEAARAWAELQPNPLRKTDALIAIAAYERFHKIESDTEETARAYALAADREFLAAHPGEERPWGGSNHGHEIPWHIVVDHLLRQRDRAAGRRQALDVIAEAHMDAATREATRVVFDGIATAAATAGESATVIRALTLANTDAPPAARIAWEPLAVAAYVASKPDTVAALVAAAPGTITKAEIHAAIASHQAQSGDIPAAIASLRTIVSFKGADDSLARAVIISHQDWPIDGLTTADPAGILSGSVASLGHQSIVSGELTGPLLANIGRSAAADPAARPALAEVIRDAKLPLRPRLWLAIGLARHLAELPALPTAPPES